MSVLEQPAASGARSEKDRWDRLEILLKPLGALCLTAVTAYVGFRTSEYLEQQQRTSAQVQLYAQLMSSREAADSSLRQQMFDTTLGAFLSSTSDASPEEKVLKLELLARNFHNSLDLAPLFEHLYRQLSAPASNPALKTRLEKLAAQVGEQQLAALEAFGARRSGAADPASLPPEGKTIIDATSLQLPGQTDPHYFTVEVLKVAPAENRVRLRLMVQDKNRNTEIDSPVEVGIFDFPMIHNLPLPGGNRCALAVTKLRPYRVEVALAYFPASRAALKEKPYYDEIFDRLVGRSGKEPHGDRAPL